jgi:hypothetical protein
MRVFFLLLVFLTGCTSPPSLPSARRQFARQHSGAAILRVTQCQVSGEGRPYAEFTFRYREPSGAEREEIWRYQLWQHAWDSTPVITTR